MGWSPRLFPGPTLGTSSPAWPFLFFLQRVSQGRMLLSFSRAQSFSGLGFLQGAGDTPWEDHAVELASLGRACSLTGDLLCPAQLGPLTPGTSLISPPPCNLEVAIKRGACTEQELMARMGSVGP